MAELSDPSTAAIDNFLAASGPTAAAPSAPAAPDAPVQDPAGVASQAVAQFLATPGTPAPSPSEPVSNWVGRHLTDLAGATVGSVPGALWSMERGVQKWRGAPSPTRSARAAFKAASPYEDLAAQAPAAAKVDPALVDPTAVVNNTPPDEPAVDPSLVKYTKTQVLNPETLGRQDLEAVNARTASQVQQRLAAIADRAARNARLTQGYVTDPATGLQVPASVVPPAAPPDPFAGLLEGTSEPTAAQALGQRAVAARAAALGAAPDTLPAPSVWKGMPAPEGAGTAQGALESVYDSPILRGIARVGSRMSPVLGPLLGAAGAGANAVDAYQSAHEGDIPSTVANAAGVLGGLMMIPDNPITPPIGAAMMAIPPAYAAWRHYGEPYVQRKLHDWFGS